MSGHRIGSGRGPRARPGSAAQAAAALKGMLAFLALLLASPLAAQEGPPPPCPGAGGAFFLEATSQYLSFQAGDLDGAAVLGNADQVFYVPRVKSSLGFGIGIGRRFRSGLWALSYLVSGHDASTRAGEATAVARQVQVNARTFLLRSTRLRPFLHFGLNFPWLRVRNGAADATGKSFDATYAGVGANAGAGFMAPVSARMFFSASLLYRYVGYLYAFGPVKGIDVTDLFDDVSGPRHRRYLRAPVIALELSLGYEL